MQKGYTPLLKKISEYLQHTRAGFHTPGHQQGKGCLAELRELFGTRALNMDLTEVPGLDNLQAPTGCLKDSQALAARLFGAQATFYLVNGSTVGLQAALLALNPPGGKVLIPRHAHIAVLNGLVLSGGRPVIMPVKVERKWGFPLGVSPRALSTFLSKQEESGEAVRLAVTVQPTYQGIGFNAAKVRQYFAAQGISQIVDEAHGAHLYFQDKYPLSMQREKADLVIQSTHKTLAALTQASMLHVNKEELLEPVGAALHLLQTTSPSYLLMASLDGVQAQMAGDGASLVEQALELAAFLRRELACIPGYEIFSLEQSSRFEPSSGFESFPGASFLSAGADKETDDWAQDDDCYQDPTKVLVSAAGLGLTGWELAEILREKYGVVVELADYYYVLFLITLGHSKEDVEKAIRALREIRKEHWAGGGKRAPLKNLNTACYEKPVDLVLSPRKVYYSMKEELNLHQSVGRICGAPLVIYPPGIPCLWPGQLIEKEQVEYLQWALQNGLQAQGLRPRQKLTVLRNC